MQRVRISMQTAIDKNFSGDTLSAMHRQAKLRQVDTLLLRSDLHIDKIRKTKEHFNNEV